MEVADLPRWPGIADRDVTPEAIRGIMKVEIPGFGETMRMKSLAITPNAILSRSLAALVDSSLVVALPGKPSGAVECLEFATSLPQTGSGQAPQDPCHRASSTPSAGRANRPRQV